MTGMSSPLGNPGDSTADRARPARPEDASAGARWPGRRTAERSRRATAPRAHGERVKAAAAGWGSGGDVTAQHGISRRRWGGEDGGRSDCRLVGGADETARKRRVVPLLSPPAFLITRRGRGVVCLTRASWPWSRRSREAAGSDGEEGPWGRGPPRGIPGASGSTRWQVPQLARCQVGKLRVRPVTLTCCRAEQALELSGWARAAASGGWTWLTSQSLR
jgi:hypothetical protein